MNSNEEVTNELKILLASSYTLYLKTHKYHWNVVGPMFSSLHTMFENQYTELAQAIDVIAERIRALGVLSPGSYDEFKALSQVMDDPGNANATTMIENLVADQEKIAEVAFRVMSKAEAQNDHVSGDLAIQRTEVHQKNAWMLRSHLAD